MMYESVHRFHHRAFCFKPPLWKMPICTYSCSTLVNLICGKVMISSVNECSSSSVTVNCAGCNVCLEVSLLPVGCLSGERWPVLIVQHWCSSLSWVKKKCIEMTIVMTVTVNWLPLPLGLISYMSRFRFYKLQHDTTALMTRLLS